jgi:hypothetical protein
MKLLETYYKGLLFWDREEQCYQTIIVIGDNLDWRTKAKGDTDSYTAWHCIAEDENERHHLVIFARVSAHYKV